MVLLADDHAMVREGMAEMLSLEDDIEVVGQAQDGRKALALARETHPHVVVLDVDMPLMGGQDALRRLLVLPSPPRVVIVTEFADPALVRELLAHGASAYLFKNAPMRDLVSTVPAVARTTPSQHVPHRDNVIVSLPRETLGGWPGMSRPPSGLSSREAEVLLHAAKGNREIGKVLHLSETTVKRHLSNVYEKLGVRSRGEATSRALAEGWISSQDLTREHQEGREGK